MKKIFTIIPLICFLITDISLAQNFRVPILVKDACNTSITIWLGVDPAGTDGFNPGLDTLAPPPPPGGFDARYRWLSEDYLTDIRGNSLTEKQFQMIYQKDVSCAPIKLYWNKTHLDSLGTFIMKDNITGTLWGPFDMTTTDSLIISADLVYIQNSLRIMVTPDSWLEPPAPPSGLTAATFSQTQINLSWVDNSNNEDGFKIERRLPPSTTWSEIATVGSNVTTYQNTGLTANTNYCYQVRAYNVGGNSAYSNEACATTLPNAPAAPSNLTAGAINQTQILVAWVDNSNNEDGFKIERRIVPSTTWTEIATVGANITTYENTGLTANTSYCYQVRAYNTGGNSAYSNETCAVTYPNVPAPPSGLTATTFSQTQINLAWTDNSNNEDGFKIERRIPPSTTWTQIATVGSNITTYQNTGLTANTNYCYQVRAYNVGGNSAYSSEACATTLPNAPAAPGGLIATAFSQTQINLSWTDNSNNEDGFKIERKIPPSTTWIEIASVGINVTAYQNTGLTIGTEYCYRVRAYNAGGNSAYSNEDCEITLPSLPASPTNLTATGSVVNKINLSWTDNSTNETGFYIERKFASLATFIRIDSVNSNAVSFSDSMISQGVSYNYRVCAYNISGQSGYSNTTYVTSILPAPGSLVGLLVTGPPYSVELSWLDLSSNELGFVVERDTVGSGSFLVLDSVIANATGYIDTSFVFHLDTFYYRIYAYTEDTVSGYSNIANLIIPVELTSFYASVSDRSVIINWTTATELNNKGFDLERKLRERWEQIAFLKGKGTTTEKSTYTFIDDFSSQSYKGIILYRLKQTDISGIYTYSNAIEVDVDFTPKEFILYQNYPNPFNPATTVRYAIPYSGKVTITLYNTLGEKLDVLVDEIKEPGIYEVEFKSDMLGSGIYFYRIETEKFVKTNKMIFMK